MAQVCGEDQMSDTLDYFWFYRVNFFDASVWENGVQYHDPLFEDMVVSK